MDKKKKLFILAGLAIIIIITIILILARSHKQKFLIDNSIVPTNLIPPTEFMSDAEKASLNLPADSKIQVLKTDESGKTEVYRVIRKDADIILDPSRIADPDMTRPAGKSVQQ
jgi:hypothetical protein